MRSSDGPQYDHNSDDSGVTAESTQLLPFGTRAREMKDHIYHLQRGYIFTTACVVAKASMPFYATIMLTARQQPFSVAIEKRRQSYYALATKPGIDCVIAADNVRYLIFYLNPLHPHFRAFRAIERDGRLALDRNAYSDLNDELAAAYEGRLDIDRADRLFEMAVQTTLQFLPPAKPVDARIDKAINILHENGSASLDELAGSVGLSYHRFSHLFAESIGITLRRYLQWKKLYSVVAMLADKSLTEIAHASGFADSSHLTKIFQELYGAPPSYFGNPEFVRRFYWTQKPNTKERIAPSERA